MNLWRLLAELSSPKKGVLLVWHSGGAQVLEGVLDNKEAKSRYNLNEGNIQKVYIVCGWPSFTSSAAGEVFQEPAVRETVDLELKAMRPYFCRNFWNATGRVESRLMQGWRLTSRNFHRMIPQAQPKSKWMGTPLARHASRADLAARMFKPLIAYFTMWQEVSTKLPFIDRQQLHRFTKRQHFEQDSLGVPFK